MNFTEYRFDKNKISALVEEKKANLITNRGINNLLAFGLGVVADRLRNDRSRYRDYGPYWWALKELMNANGYSMGDQSDPIVSDSYRGGTDEETLIMADEFRTMNLGQNVIGTNKFMLDGDSGEFWELFDPDMENPT
ncbi:hypothetical protein SAMN05216326_12731 [Nitrosomonas marina]|uniref:Uncharacterized protein n=1 Tax=Nitrosomonas marina TaxID=917 RepID=A0A1I0EHJ3_9PROT|nr:hypothetical protein [Nitrosomonas marina]SET44390.1 hypothetical protein SAMN05216326_12731 [Nitrosomonas marina]